MNRKRISGFGISIGSSTLIMVFSILCLVVFALLSYKTAYNEYNLARKAEKEMKAYYVADGKAIDRKESIELRLKKGQSISKFVDYSEVKKGKTYYGYAIKIDKNKKLEVELERKGIRLIPVKWKEVNNASGNYKNKLEVIGD